MRGCRLCYEVGCTGVGVIGEPVEEEEVVSQCARMLFNDPPSSIGVLGGGSEVIAYIGGVKVTELVEVDRGETEDKKRRGRSLKRGGEAHGLNSDRLLS